MVQKKQFLERQEPSLGRKKPKDNLINNMQKIESLHGDKGPKISEKGSKSSKSSSNKNSAWNVSSLSGGHIKNQL